MTDKSIRGRPICCTNIEALLCMYRAGDVLEDHIELTGFGLAYLQHTIAVFEIGFDFSLAAG